MRIFWILLLVVTLTCPALAATQEERAAKKRAAVEEVLAKADAGDVQCMQAGGLMLLQGKLVSRDRDRGIALLERAAETGDGLAITALYDLYEKGRYGVPKDPDRADYWAEKGNIVSPRIKARNDRMIRKELQRQAGDGSAAAATMLAISDAGNPDIATLEKNALADDGAAIGVLFHLHMQKRYEPGPDVVEVMHRHGLMTRDEQAALADKAKDK